MDEAKLVGGVSRAADGFAVQSCALGPLSDGDGASMSDDCFGEGVERGE